MNQDAGVAAKASWKPNVYSCGLGGSQMRKNYINMRRTPKWGLSPIHTSIEDSREIIRTVLSAPGIYAVVLKETNLPVGSIGLTAGAASNMDLGPEEAEIGYWIGVPYWGQGLIPEATKEIMRHGFEDLRLKTIWCGYFEGNEKSKRVQEKCGFHSHHMENDKLWPLMNDIRTEYITYITREEWEEQKRQGGVTGC